VNNSPTIGFVGTGIMGSHMARRLASAGFCVNAWNRSAEKLGPLGAHGVRAAASPAAALAGVDTAIVMLSTAAVIEAVLFRHGTDGRAPIGSLATGSTLIVMSSIPIDEARRQAAALAERGVQYLDAPVSGGEP
jgi:3-hydroxyisobutyrate dehydrogenase-like beta-hydroxyacid dehydrogenase